MARLLGILSKGVCGSLSYTVIVAWLAGGSQVSRSQQGSLVFAGSHWKNAQLSYSWHNSAQSSAVRCLPPWRYAPWGQWVWGRLLYVSRIELCAAQTPIRSWTVKMGCIIETFRIKHLSHFSLIQFQSVWEVKLVYRLGLTKSLTIITRSWSTIINFVRFTALAGYAFTAYWVEWSSIFHFKNFSWFFFIWWR